MNLSALCQPSPTVAHKCNGETKSHGKTNFNSRFNKINLQSNETSRENKTNSRQNNINSRQNNINSRQNKINSRQNKISSRQNTINSRQNTINSRQNTINSRQNKNKLTVKYKLTQGKIECGTSLNIEEIALKYYFRQGYEYDVIVLFLSKFHALLNKHYLK